MSGVTINTGGATGVLAGGKISKLQQLLYCYADNLQLLIKLLIYIKEYNYQN